MSIRHKILAALASNPKTMDEMSDALPEFTRKQISDNMAAALADELVSKSKDSVTGLPLYSVTEKGKGRMKEGVGSRGGESMQAIASERKASQVTISGKPSGDVETEGLREENLRLVEKAKKLEADMTGLRNLNDSLREQIAVHGNENFLTMAHHLCTEIGIPQGNIETRLDAAISKIVDEPPRVDHRLQSKANAMLTERLVGVAHALRGSGLPALANIDDGEDMQPHVAALAGAYQMTMAGKEDAIDSLREWRDMAKIFDSVTPSELMRYIKNLPCRPKERAVDGYACMVGVAEIYPDETAARMAAESALLEFAVGQSVAVVAIVAQAENVMAPLWKEAA